jgi:ribose transport system ATP-binding protein
MGAVSDRLMARTDLSAPFWRMNGISKRYGGVRALENVGLTVQRGKIHAVLGENGAGKSTLIKIMSGVVQPDSGTMEIEGRPVRFETPADAMRSGVVSIFQELSLVPDLSVAENICAPDPPRRFGLIDRRAQRRRAEGLLARVHCEDIHPDEVVRNLPLSRRQMIEIARALGRSPRLLILDEATSALAAADVERIYAMLDRLRTEGLAIVYISHRMREIMAFADDCSIFRNGRHVESFSKGSKSGDEIVKLMIGRDYKDVYPEKPLPARSETPILEVENLNWGARLAGISLHVRKGEVVGLGGLDGQGQRELLLALFGVLRGVEARIKIDGVPRKIKSPRDAKRRSAGMALIPEDRQIEGLVSQLSVRDNISLAAIHRFARSGFIRARAEADAVKDAFRTLSIHAGGPDVPVATLSGGNQQKVVIAKWLLTQAKLVLLNDPTRGIDVGTKQEIYKLLRKLADSGKGLLFYSTDYAELVGCCDRVVMLYEGRVVRELAGEALTEQKILTAALNLPDEAVRARETAH